MEEEKKELLDRMQKIISKPGGKQAVRFVLNSFGSIPIVGGVFAATSDLWEGKQQQEFNEKIAKWASNMTDGLGKVLDYLDSELRNPSKANMALLIGEVLGVDLPDSYTKKSSMQFRAILNNDTITELKPFIQNGWIKLTPNGNAVDDMRGRPQFSGCIIDKKRPFGSGTGFTLSIEEQYYE